MAFLGRIVVVLFAFLIASLAAALVLQVGIMVPFWHGVVSPDIDQGFFRVILGVGFFFIAAFSLLPALIVIALAEAFRLRSILFYAAAGGLEAVAISYSLGLFDPGTRPLAQAFAAAGIAAGLVYWLLAGRNAGRWQEPVRSAP